MKINTGFSVGVNFSGIHQEDLVGGWSDISGVKNPRPKIPTACTPRVVVEGLGPPGGCSGALRCGVAPIGTDKLDIYGLCENCTTRADWRFGGHLPRQGPSV